jgi:signal transduction histidine kinase
MAKQKNVEEFFLINRMIQGAFEYLDQRYDTINGELNNRVNTLYNLMLNDAFKPLKNDLKAAKLLISSNVKEGFYEVYKIAMDGAVIDSSIQDKSGLNNANPWLKGDLDLTLYKDRKIYISPLSLNLEMHLIQIYALVLAPNQEEFLQISYQEAFPDIVFHKIEQIKKDFSNLKELQIHLIDHYKQSMIDIQLQRANSQYDYDDLMQKMLNIYNGSIQGQEDKKIADRVGLIQYLKEKNYIFNSQNNVNTFYMINSALFNMLGNNELLIKASLVQNQSREINFIQKMVLYSFFIALLAVLYFYYSIQKNVVLPLEHITAATFKNQPITDKKILSNHNEISMLAKSINYLNHRLSRQIDLKNRLIENQKIFISNAIHELSTPLNVINLNTNLLEMEYGKNDPINYILSAIKQIMSIKEDVTFVMLNRHIEYKTERIELCAYLKERIEFFSQIAWVNDKTVHFKCDAQVFIEMSHTELSLLINNNISNAVKYGVDSKDIYIEAAVLDHAVKLSFASSSKPILETQKVFQRFYRENSSRKGFGIGLNIVFNICKKYHIEHEIQSGGGYNTFVYHIPLGDNHEDSAT